MPTNILLYNTVTTTSSSSDSGNHNNNTSKYMVWIVVRRINNQSIWYAVLCCAMLCFGFYSHTYVSERMNEREKEYMSVSACMYAYSIRNVSKTKAKQRTHYTLWTAECIRKTHKERWGIIVKRMKERTKWTNKPGRMSEQANKLASM